MALSATMRMLDTCCWAREDRRYLELMARAAAEHAAGPGWMECRRMGQTVVEKIAQTHLAEGPRRPLRAGDFVSIRPRHVLTHDNTSPALKKFLALGATRVLDPRQPVFALDHDIQNRSDDNLKKYRT